MASFLKATVLAAVLVAATLPAEAADMPGMKDAPDTSPVHEWSGAYMGVHLGYGWGRHSSVDYATPPDLPQEPGFPAPFGGFSCAPALSGYYCGLPFKYDADGTVGGAQAGYNWQRGLLVFGIEGDLGRLNVSQQALRSRTVGMAFDEDVAKVDYGWYASLTGRIGLAHNRALYYLKGGVVAARISHTAYDLDDGNHDGDRELYSGSYTESHNAEIGWAAGAGIEYAFASNWSVKAEYLYMDFGPEITDDPDGDLYRHQSRLHTVKAALNYQFRYSADEPLK